MRQVQIPVGDLSEKGPSRTDPSRPRPSRIEAISPSQQDLGKARQPPAGANPHLSIFIDESIEAAGDDIPKAVKTDC